MADKVLDSQSMAYYFNNACLDKTLNQVPSLHGLYKLIHPQNHPQNLDLSYQAYADFKDCFGR